MERKRKEASKNRGFYIAVSCCAAVIAIVGYVSWFTGNREEEIPKNTEISQREIVQTPNLSEAAKIALREEKEPERATVPVGEKSMPAAKNVIAEDNVPEFAKPVEGKVICEFSGDKLIFCKTLSDWRTHDGVDIKAKEGESVLASADGVVESVYADSMGNCVVIDHENGLKTLYANLAGLNNELVGKNVSKGDEIGTVGNSALADFSEEVHLHFEILKDDIPQNPQDYLK